MSGQQTELLHNDAVITAPDGKTIGGFSASLATDEQSWAWSFTIQIEDAAIWQSLLPDSGTLSDIDLTVRGIAFGLTIEGGESRMQRSSVGYTLNGRSRTARLDRPHAEPISKTWAGTTAKTIALELAGAQGITLQWDTVDWPLPSHTAEQQTPIAIIQQLAKAVGAIVQTAADGITLIVRPLWPVSPHKFDQATPAHILTDIDDITDTADAWEYRPGHNTIDISTDTDAADIAVTIEEQAAAGARVLKLFIVPFQDVIIKDSSDGRITITDQGTHMEEITETIEIVEGQGAVAKPWYGTVSWNWKYDDLGEPAITESGRVTTSLGQSLLEITYTTQWRQYVAASDQPKVQVWVEKP